MLKRELSPGCELIDGKQIAQEIRQEIKESGADENDREREHAWFGGRFSWREEGLQSYVRSKKKMCAEVGIRSEGTDLPEDATEEEVLKVVRAYNADPNIHGILVQLPMPKHINEEASVEGGFVREGRGRVPPVEHRRVESTRRRAEVCAVHAKRMHRVVETLQRRDEREESSRRGPLNVIRYAGGVVVAKKRRHGNCSAFAHEEPGGGD